MPKWNPINICSYHLQEAGATPVQELAFSLCTAIAVLDAVRDSGQVRAERFGDVVARISFFVNAGVRFVEEMCKMRAFTRLWDELTRERYGVQDPKQRRFRYGVQVNSLGLTEAQPENNVQRIVLEMLGVTCRRTPAPAPSSSPRGTRRSGCRARGTSSGRCASSRCSPSSPTCSSTTTCSTGRASSRRRSPSSGRRRAGRDRPDPGDGRRGRGHRDRLHEAGAGRLARAAPAGSSPARTSWSASTRSPRPSPRR